MADQRALLTKREREILAGEAEVKDNYRYSVESRVRTRLRDELAVDMEILEKHHEDIASIVSDVVCGEREAQPSAEQPHSREQTPQREPSTDTGEDIQHEEGELAGVEFPGAVERTEAIAAVYRARAFIRERGGASMKEIVREVMPEHPLTYDAEEALEKIAAGGRYKGGWWRSVVKPGLKALEDIEQPAPGYSEWQYVGES